MTPLVLALCLFVQDADGKKTFSDALEKTIAGGGMKIVGVARNNGADDPIFAQLGATSLAFMSGRFEAVADPGGFRVLTVVRKDGRADVYQSGDKRISKEIWEKKRMNLGTFADDVLSLLNLKRMAKHLEKAEFDKPEQLTGEQEGARVEGTIPGGLIEQAESEDVMSVMTRFHTTKLKVKAVIDAEGRFKTLEFVLEKKNDYMDLVREQLGMEKKKGPDVTMTYAIAVQKLEEGLKPDVPKEVLRYFEE